MENLKQLDNIKILWHLGYYDGVLSGIALYEDEMVYFDLMEEYEKNSLIQKTKIVMLILGGIENFECINYQMMTKSDIR